MSTRLGALFLTALSGVLVVVGLALVPLGWPALAPYGLVVVVGLGLLLRRAARLRRPTGRTCSCCTSTVYDPVEIR